MRSCTTAKKRTKNITADKKNKSTQSNSSGARSRCASKIEDNCNSLLHSMSKWLCAFFISDQDNLWHCHCQSLPMTPLLTYTYYTYLQLFSFNYLHSRVAARKLVEIHFDFNNRKISDTNKFARKANPTVIRFLIPTILCQTKASHGKIKHDYICIYQTIKMFKLHTNHDVSNPCSCPIQLNATMKTLSLIAVFRSKILWCQKA